MAKKTLSNAHDREEIIARTKKIQPSTARRWGKMNAHQMICHLADSFRVIIGEKSVSPAGWMGPRMVIKWIAFEVPLPWPRGVKTRPEVDQFLAGTKPIEFDIDREELLHLFRRFTAESRDFQFHPHPMFGAMSDSDWMRWGYLHMDHHLRQFGV